MSLRQATKWKNSHWGPHGELKGASGVSPGLEKELILSRATLGEVLAVQEWAGNNVVDEGEAWILEAAFHNEPGTGFTDFQLKLAANAASSLTESTANGTITEVTGTGYGAKTVLRAQSAGNWSTVTGTTPSSITTPDTGNHTFTATGADWTTAHYAVLVANATADVLIAWSALNPTAGRALGNGDSLNLTMDIQAGGS